MMPGSANIIVSVGLMNHGLVAAGFRYIYWNPEIVIPSPTPGQTAIIDLSHNGTGGYSFGTPTDEVKRWQTFIANSYPTLTKVEVKIRKWELYGQNDVTVELYATDNTLCQPVHHWPKL